MSLGGLIVQNQEDDNNKLNIIHLIQIFHHCAL